MKVINLQSLNTFTTTLIQNNMFTFHCVEQFLDKLIAKIKHMPILTTNPCDFIKNMHYKHPELKPKLTALSRAIIINNNIKSGISKKYVQKIIMFRSIGEHNISICLEKMLKTTPSCDWYYENVNIDILEEFEKYYLFEFLA